MCWKSFITIKIKYDVRIFSSQKKSVVSMINKILVVKYAICYA